MALALSNWQRNAHSFELSQNIVKELKILRVEKLLKDKIEEKLSWTNEIHHGGYYEPATLIKRTKTPHTKKRENEREELNLFNKYLTSSHHVKCWDYNSEHNEIPAFMSLCPSSYYQRNIWPFKKVNLTFNLSQTHFTCM